MKLRAPGRKAVLIKPVYANAGEMMAYQRQLEKLIDAMHSSVMFHVKAAWRRAGLPETKMAKDAGPEAALTKAMNKLGKQWLDTFNSSSKDIAKKFAAAAKRNHDMSFSSGLRKAGFTVDMSSLPEIDFALGGIISENVDLIRSIPQEYFDDVIERVRESVEKGRSMGELTDHLENRYGVTRRRAALIARDQNNKATAAIHRIRQKQVGIKKAKWIHTSASAHPREEHISWDGQTYDIDTGMYSDVDGEFVWPGTPINCGCTSMSVVPGLDDDDEEEQ